MTTSTNKYHQVVLAKSFDPLRATKGEDRTTYISHIRTILKQLSPNRESHNSYEDFVKPKK